MKTRSRRFLLQILASGTIAAALSPWTYGPTERAMAALVFLSLCGIAGRFILMRWDKKTVRWLVVGAGLVVSALVASLATGIHATWSFIIVLLFTSFLAGLRLGRPDWQHHDALQLLVLGAFSLGTAHAVDGIVKMPTVVIFAVSGLLTLAASREQQERSYNLARGAIVEGRTDWFVMVVGVLLIALLGILVVTDGTMGLIKYVGWAISFVVEKMVWLLWPLAFLAEKLVALIGRREEQPLKPFFDMSELDKELQEKQMRPISVAPWVGYVVLAVIVTTVLYLVVRSISSHLSGSNAEVEEERESIFSLAALTAGWRLPHFRLGRRRLGTGLAENPGSATELYAWVLHWCYRLGRARSGQETPREFVPAAIKVLEGCEEAVEQLTSSFEAEKYGGTRVPPEEIENLREALTQVATIARAAIASRRAVSPKAGS